MFGRIWYFSRLADNILIMTLKLYSGQKWTDGFGDLLCKVIFTNNWLFIGDPGAKIVQE
jgi:hypothetical protein